jgi:hypothetical protein
MSRKFLGAEKRLPWFTEIKVTLSLDIVRVVQSNGLPDNAVHISDFRGEAGKP